MLLNPFSICPRGSKVENMGGITDGDRDIGSQGCHGNCVSSFLSSKMSFCCYFMLIYFKIPFALKSIY